MNNSLWWTRTAPTGVRPTLTKDADADVVIVGAGFTGIWTAHYLTWLQPSLRIIVLEAGRVGFGASGRNGGWCSALFPAELPTIAAEYGDAAAVAMGRAMHDTVAEVGRVASAHGIDCDWAHGGSVYLARSEAQLARAHDYVAQAHRYGFGPADYRVLDSREAAERLNATNTVGAVYTPHCAAIDPLKLLRGVAAQVESAGVTIHEGSRVVGLAPGEVVTVSGRKVRAPVVIRATEAYSALLPREKRTIAPVYSLMIATEPLNEHVWKHIGLVRRETFNDLRHLIIYGQRTADDRLAFGGRGAPYHVGSAIRATFDSDDTVHAELHRILVELFPVLTDVRISHRWGGPLGIARDWWARVMFDPSTGRGWAGGYVGDGVGSSNLAGRTLAHLITGVPSTVIDLPWVNRPMRRWEPEPVRWLGANAALAAMRFADASEARTGRPSRMAKAVNSIIR